MAIKTRQTEEEPIIEEGETRVADFHRELALLSDAAIAAIFVRAREPLRAANAVQDWAAIMGMDFMSHNVIDGWTKYHNPADIKDSPDVDIRKPTGAGDKVIDAVKAIDVFCTSTRPTCGVMLLEQHQFMGPAAQLRLKLFIRDGLTQERRLILIAPPEAEIPPGLEDDLKIVDFLTPSLPGLRAVYEQSIADFDPERFPGDTVTPDQLLILLNNAAGMTELEFGNAVTLGCLTWTQQEARNEELDVDGDGETEQLSLYQHMLRAITRSKVEIVKRNSILELMKPVDIASVGGLDLLKGWLAKRIRSATPEARAFGVEPMKGYFLVGPPGCGKSVAAKATGSVLGVPVIKLDIGKVFGSLVGQSEAQIRAALAMIEAMAPCVLFIDEIDKGLGGIGQGGDSGTSSRVLGTILTWMQERDVYKAQVTVIATANNVQGLPPELFRPGRFDQTFAIKFPNEQERVDILRIHVESRRQALTDDDYADVASMTPGYSGAELEAAVKESLLDAFNDNKDYSVDYLRRAVRNIVPLSKSRATEVKAMDTWAEQNARPASSIGKAAPSPARKLPPSGNRVLPVDSKQRLVPRHRLPPPGKA